MIEERRMEGVEEAKEFIGERGLEERAVRSRGSRELEGKCCPLL